MAWNESFSGEQGGGWGAGETSFATAGPKDTAASKTAERLAVPVSISDLVDSANMDEKFVLGDYPFSTVLVMGNVRAYETGETTTTYVVYDPEDESKEYRIISYHGLDENQGAEIRSPFVEGTRVMALGKLRHFNDNFGIMSYDVKEVLNDKEYQAFTLEAKIAKLYFTKGVHDILQKGQGGKLDGTCLGSPAPSTGGTAGGASQGAFARQDNASTFASQPQRLYNQNAPASSTSHGMSGLKGRIMELLDAERNSHGENGMSIDDVKAKLGCMNMNQLRSDLEFLVSEGHVYATINDDHFALIS